jgi:outer membrane protein OmpA-like peptidoglycan-associated protein
MEAVKKNGVGNLNRFLFAARYVTFLMTFLMLFVFPFLPLLVGCQVTHVIEPVHAVDQGQGAPFALHAPASTVVRAIEEASVGGHGGEIIAAQMDHLAQRLSAAFKDASVERLHEGILITLGSQALFKDDCYDLQSVAKTKFKDLVKALLTYEHINALVEVHTDNTAEESYHYILSEKRAYAVERFLVSQGLKGTRVRSHGYGEKQPLTSNETGQGKQLNRRVEVALYANEEIRMMAEDGRSGGFMALMDTP